ncbi:hypothetical protein ACH4NT_05870 [Streptomyces lydicus]|uniref:hypothetical protein n=1 Tax=Streptomyces lydicus TaxID=47763 RepID=UPI003799E3CA
MGSEGDNRIRPLRCPFDAEFAECGALLGEQTGFPQVVEAGGEEFNGALPPRPAAVSSAA